MTPTDIAALRGLLASDTLGSYLSAAQHIPALLDEVEALRHDNERHVAIASDLATEVEALREALQAITDHFAAVMDGPIAKAGGITWRDGVDGIPTIKAARAILAKVKP